MELAHLISELSKPAAWPFRADQVEVRQTHISAVFLAGDIVYKIKKPVDFGFLDFTQLERRKHFCEEEVRLNRRLAPDVYLGVVPVTRKNGALRFEGDGEALEWAVKMRRLPDEATLLYQVEHEAVTAEAVEALARRLADFHGQSDRGPKISSTARFEGVARNLRANFEISGSQVGKTVSMKVFDHLVRMVEQGLLSSRELINDRASRDVPRDCHGDLHLDHVYLFPEKKPPEDFVVVDCIEFTERFRFIDPISDMCFLRMEFLFYGRPDLAEAFTEAYFRASGDEEGRRLVPLYTAYRACVRAKVEGLELLEAEVPEGARARAATRARAHWLLALGEIEKPGRRPALVLVAGLPGTGKSTLAKELAREGNFELIRSDEVRKELAAAAGVTGEALYSKEMSRRTYEECLRRAQVLLFDGKRVLVDANFRKAAQREEFLKMAVSWGVRSVVLVCSAPEEIVRKRLEIRRGDASEATWEVYKQLKPQWESLSSSIEQRSVSALDTGGTVAQGMAAALQILRAKGLAS